MIAGILATAGYLITVYILAVEKSNKKIFWIPLLIAIFAHTYLLASVDLNNFSLMNTLSLVTYLMAFIGFGIAIIKKDYISCSVVCLISAICLWFPIMYNMPTLEHHFSWGIKTHVAFSISAYVSLAFAALYACFLLIQDRHLRAGKDLNTIPLALNYIEKTMISFALIGEVLLTISLVTGLLFIGDIWQQHISHKLVFSVISWFIMAVLLFRHYKNGFRGAAAAKWLLSGFILLVLAYFGSAFVLQIILKVQ